MINKKESREAFVEIESKWTFFRKWYKLNKREPLSWSLRYSLTVIFKVILSLLISGLSDTILTNVTDIEDLKRSSSSRPSMHILDAIIYFFV